MPKQPTVVIRFKDHDDLLDWVEETFGGDVTVYLADSMDAEFKGSGRAPSNTYVVRHSGQKPDGMALVREDPKPPKRRVLLGGKEVRE